MEKNDNFVYVPDCDGNLVATVGLFKRPRPEDDDECCARETPKGFRGYTDDSIPRRSYNKPKFKR
jgi:hypothetical protein